MNVYDLEKLATPGPLEVCEELGRMNKVCRTLRYSTPFNRFGGKRNVIGVWEVHSSSGDVYTGVDMSEPDARLLAHCRNNFGKALELLKRVAAYSNENKRLSPYELKAVLNQTIAELEEVET